MAVQPLFRRFLGMFDPAGTKKYFTQLSLILCSLLLATSVDRCREAQKNQTKLHESLVAIRQEIKEEIQLCQLNHKDSKRDIKCLGLTLYYLRQSQPDSVAEGLKNFVEVYQRGVFRAFPPNTIEMLGESGDLQLLKDLNLRSHLAGAAAFRRNVVQTDLNEFDRATQQCAAELGRYVDLSRLMLFSEPLKAISDPKGLAQADHNEIFLLIRTAQNRAFHLDNSIEEWQEVAKMLDAFLASNPQ